MAIVKVYAVNYDCKKFSVQIFADPGCGLNNKFEFNGSQSRDEFKFYELSIGIMVSEIEEYTNVYRYKADRFIPTIKVVNSILLNGIVRYECPSPSGGKITSISRWNDGKIELSTDKFPSYLSKLEIKGESTIITKLFLVENYDTKHGFGLSTSLSVITFYKCDEEFCLSRAKCIRDKKSSTSISSLSSLFPELVNCIAIMDNEL